MLILPETETKGGSRQGCPLSLESSEAELAVSPAFAVRFRSAY